MCQAPVTWQYLLIRCPKPNGKSKLVPRVKNKSNYGFDLHLLKDTYCSVDTTLLRIMKTRTKMVWKSE